MKIAFVHYHLKTGGVTTVIKQQVRSLPASCRVLALTGETPSGSFACPVVRISGLEYDQPGNSPPSPEEIADAIIQAIRRQWSQGCDLLHVHNPLLAKNRQLIKVLKILQHKGIRLLLQIHDFAEDGRPSVYYRDAYPKNCHYAVINSRDYRILLEAGLKPQGLHFIANHINPIPLKRPASGLPPYILYPVRAIRRKNIGEAILLSFFINSDEAVAITLPPHSPSDMQSYSAWKRLVSTHRLKVAFELGQQHAFASLVASARSLVTTSISEGFGFSFLEPWTAGKLLWGRRLVDICRDFIDNGLDLSHLYTRMAVPLKWIDRHRFLARWQTALTDACRLFDYQIDPQRVAEAWTRMTDNDTIDFGVLHEDDQRQVIERMLKHKGCAGDLIEVNPILKNPGAVTHSKTLIAQNNTAVFEHYTAEGYGKRLLAVYGQVVKTPVRHGLDKSRLIDLFLDLSRFSLLKWKPYV